MTDISAAWIASSTYQFLALDTLCSLKFPIPYSQNMHKSTYSRILLRYLIFFKVQSSITNLHDNLIFQAISTMHGLQVVIKFWTWSLAELLKVNFMLHDLNIRINGDVCIIHKSCLSFFCIGGQTTIWLSHLIWKIG